MNKAPIIGICRLRINSDGQGITTLVAFHSCPLKCKYCINPQALVDGHINYLSAEKIMNILRKDELYFLATKGGVTFGGGEPLLWAEFIKDILDLGAKEWHVTIETSLNVQRCKLELLLPYIDEYIVDIKDMNPIIYKAYTSKDNSLVIDNLNWLVSQKQSNKIICRIPLIEGYNTEEDRLASRTKLLSMGIERFDMFSYTINTYILTESIESNRIVTS